MKRTQHLALRADTIWQPLTINSPLFVIQLYIHKTCLAITNKEKACSKVQQFPGVLLDDMTVNISMQSINSIILS